MKKKDINSLRSKSLSKLKEEEDKLRAELAKIKLDSAVNAPKDTNAFSKMRARLAVILTIMREKEIQEKEDKKLVVKT